jgi:1-aminocyclopropane-1-carboxylate deaminase/D-cysteine desulfhydrase-like pyridoxal-dependent ACC family enzyme
VELTAYPCIRLGTWPTPLVRARRLEARLRSGPLLVKRDDLSGFAFAGNKTRQLEYLLGSALSDGYEALVVGGVATSNFCAGAAVAARIAGIECHIVLPGEPPAPASANLAMALDCGVQVTFSGSPRELLDERIRDRAAALTAGGRRAMAIPRGGASPLGALGFFRAAVELCDQLVAAGYHRARLVIPVGSGGSVAGLYAASVSQPVQYSITGVSVSRPLATLEPHLRELVHACGDLAGVPPPDPAALELIEVVDGPHDTAYGVDAAEQDAALLALETEGLVLDPHYTARAFPIALRLLNELKEEALPVVFWHTGGAPAAISAYALAANTSNGARANVMNGAS